MFDVVMIAVGVLGLWIGTEAAVHSGGEIGRRLGVSEFILGCTVFAIGTDLSELSVSIQSAIRLASGANTSGLVVGNALGSVLAQGALVLGILSLFQALGQPGKDSTTLRHAAVWIGSTAILALLAGDAVITRVDGMLLVLTYAAYLYWIMRENVPSEGAATENSPISMLGLVLALVLGLAMVVASAELAIEHATLLAARSGIDPTAIGLFGLAVGTSLPELALSVGAIARGHAALSVGNILGSNVFDLLVPIGVAGMIHPVDFDRNSLFIELPVIAVLAIYFAIRLSGSKRFGPGDALGLLGSYLAYVFFRLGTFVA